MLVGGEIEGGKEGFRRVEGDDDLSFGEINEGCSVPGRVVTVS